MLNFIETMCKMKSLAHYHIWWPGIVEDKRDGKSMSGLLYAKQWSWPCKPWQRVRVDFVEPFMEKYFILSIDTHSKWDEVFKMTSISLVHLLHQLYAAFKLPHLIVSDNGPQLVSKEFSLFMEANRVKHTH